MSIHNDSFIINNVYNNILKQKKIGTFEISAVCSMNGGDEYSKC